MKPLLKKTTRDNLEERIRDGVDREQLAADREKIAKEQIHIRTKAMEFTLDGIFIIDARKSNFPIVYANPSFYNLTGYTKHEVMGKNYFLLYGAGVNTLLLEEIKEIIGKGQSFHGEILNFRKNGEKFWSLLRIAPVRDAHGNVTHYVGIKTDTTLMKQREMEIAEQREEILHVTRVGKLAEFVSSLAHEISQPLTSMLSYAQAAQRMLGNREPELHEILQYIVNDNQRATDVIRRLRVLLKKNQPVLEPIHINTLIRDTAALIFTHITVRNKTITFDLAADLPSIQGDRVQLQQVLLNLISNSLEAMENTDDSSKLLLRSWRKDADTIMVEVEDSGTGITEEHMDKIFTHFFTSKPDGLGMGLSISRSIVEAHGGLLEAKNNDTGGATFFFTLPIDKKDAL